MSEKRLTPAQRVANCLSTVYGITAEPNAIELLQRTLDESNIGYLGPEKVELKLKSCPFCGGKAEFEEKEGSWGYSSAELKVKCTGCWCETESLKTEEHNNEIGNFSILTQVQEKLIKE